MSKDSEDRRSLITNPFLPAVALAVLATVAILPGIVSAHDGHHGEVVATGEALSDDDQTWLDQLLSELLVGNVEAAATFTMSTNGATRIIVSDGLPNHATGQFPNSGNPHSITTQSYQFSMPANPTANGSQQSSEGYLFGVALNGVVFDPATAEYWNRDRSSGWRYEAISANGPSLGLDDSNAHVQPNGAYHYHGLPDALLNLLSDRDAPTLIGYAADGFPIYGPLSYQDADDPSSGLVEMQSSYVLKSGTRDSGPGGTYDGTFTQDWSYAAGSGTLDECNGRVGVTDEYPEGTYYYVITDEFPFIPRCFVGTPDNSFSFQNARSDAGQSAGTQSGSVMPSQRPNRPRGGFPRPPRPRG